MSLFATINNSAGALQSAQLGLQTIGNNVANANTDGYIRQNYVQGTPAPSRYGNLILGHGVRGVGIVQQIDQALAERMWDAGSSLASANIKEKTLHRFGSLMNDLDDGGLSADLSSLNGALHNLANEPNDSSLRQFVMLSGEALTQEVNRMHKETMTIRAELDQGVFESVDKINSLTNKIAELNLRITNIEGGRTVRSDATGLRDDRYRALEELSQLIDINVQEQATGSVSVFVAGDFLVAESHQRELYVSTSNYDTHNRVKFVETNSDVEFTGGELHALQYGRDVIVGDVLEGLDRLAKDLIREFNTVHSQGQGRRGFESLTGAVVVDVDAPFAEAGLNWVPEGGSFDLRIVDSSGKHLSAHRIEVRMGDESNPGTIQDVLDQISAIDGLVADVLPDGQIRIRGEQPGTQFTFGEDTSGFVAAAGLNTFFVGYGAETLSINATLKNDHDLLATSRGGIGNDTDALNQLVDLIDEPMDRYGGQSIRDNYSRMSNKIVQTSASQKAATDGLRSFYSTLQGEHLAITGVNIDEESIKMIGYQRAFQASSRVIATANEMLEMLTAL